MTDNYKAAVSAVLDLCASADKYGENEWANTVLTGEIRHAILMALEGKEWSTSG